MQGIGAKALDAILNSNTTNDPVIKLRCLQVTDTIVEEKSKW